MVSNIIIGFTLMNIIIGISLGFLLFKLGELILRKMYKSNFIEASFDKTMLSKKNASENKIESIM